MCLVGVRVMGLMETPPPWHATIWTQPLYIWSTITGTCIFFKETSIILDYIPVTDDVRLVEVCALCMFQQSLYFSARRPRNVRLQNKWQTWKLSSLPVFQESCLGALESLALFGFSFQLGLLGFGNPTSPTDWACAIELDHKAS